MPRWQLLLGKYLGLWLTLAAEVALLTALYTAVVGFQQGLPSRWVYASMGMLMLELTLLTAWATFFSTFATPMTAAAFSICTYLAGHFADDLYLFGQRAEPGVGKTVMMALYRVLPNLEMFNIRIEAVHGVAVPLSEFAWCTAYSLGYSALILIAAMAIFEKRDFA
jgi:ABC-type transport system involved in multi-copper enzyme maturation permease subunit